MNKYLKLTLNRSRVSDSYKRCATAIAKGNYVARTGDRTLARRPHPYFGKINRLEQADSVTPGKGGGRAPKMTPEEQQGVLWQAIRKGSEPG